MDDNDKQETERIPVVFEPCGTCGTRQFTYDGKILECENGHTVVLSADQRLTFWVDRRRG